MYIFLSRKDGETFSSIYEYEGLLRALKNAEDNDLIEEVPVSARREVPQVEHWYREKGTGAVYSLLPPEFPAKGYWGPVPLGDFQLSAQYQ